MKKAIVFLLIAAISISSFTACQKANTTVGNSSSQEQTSAKTPALSDIVQAVKDAYGENYLPNMSIEKDQLTDIYYINMDDVEDYFAEGPMISAHIDTFIALKAKAGKGSALEKELQTYLDYVVENSMQYPSNIAKVQSAQVVRQGDYVFYVMLGAFDENMEASEEDAVTFAKEQIQVGIDAINNCF